MNRDENGKPVKTKTLKFCKCRAQKSMLDNAKAKQRDSSLNRCLSDGVVV